MKARHALAAWKGVRMRKAQRGADPDSPVRCVSLPADWDDEAASALARLAPGEGAVSLAEASACWIDPLAMAAADDGALARQLRLLLLQRAAAPNQTVWRGLGRDMPGFVVNLAAFAEAGAGFELDGFVAALHTVATALRLFSRRASCVQLGNLDACLALLGLDYDSDAGRDVAAWLCALTTASLHPGHAPRHGLEVELPLGGYGAPSSLARRAQAAWRQAVRGSRETTELFTGTDAIESGFSAPGPAGALLGFEACGIAPVFSPLTPDGRLASSTLARLAARGLSPEAAFAASLAGEAVLRRVDPAAAQAMHRASSPFIDRVPAAAPSCAPLPLPSGVGRRRELPARHGGFTQKASVGGHRLFVRTGEYEDGSLGEVEIIPARDGAAQRGLMEAFGQAVSLGLQHGVPLDAYVEAFAYSRIGPHGAVEGDSAVGSASSLLDYAFRTLAHAYGGRILPDAPGGPGEAPEPASGEALLPLDLPRASNGGVRQHHGLRLVG